MRLDEEGLARWGRRIGAEVRPPVLLCLRGPLGAGKSVLARAVGAGAGVAEPMPSPSFNLLFQYDARERSARVIHLDLYRLAESGELWELGWEELGQPDQIVLVEWPDRAGDLLPEDYWLIDLHIVPGKPRLRDVSVHRVGKPPELPPFPMTVST
jgi:tRNA threonylcarbamoyladenosine biosynthesis protein TsaE